MIIKKQDNIVVYTVNTNEITTVWYVILIFKFALSVCFFTILI
jgi:hypothetical protein